MKDTIDFIAWVLKESSSTLRIHWTITVMTTPTLTASSCFWHVWNPTHYNSRGSGSCFNYWLRCDLVLIILQSQYPFLLTQVEIMTQQTETCMSRAIRILSKCYAAPIGVINPSIGLFHLLSEFIGQLMMDFLDPSSSSTVINRIFPCKLSKIDHRQQKDWAEFEVGPECFECACSPTYSCGVAYSRKEVI